MYVESCPMCGRKPKIKEWNRDECGNKRWFVRCPNYCPVIKSQNQLCGCELDFGIYYKGDADRNMLYKLWNKAIKENNNA